MPIRDYVRDGPEAGGQSALRRTLGLYLWWRTWTLIVILMFAILVTMNVLSDGPGGRLSAFIIGGLFALIFNRLFDGQPGVLPPKTGDD